MLNLVSLPPPPPIYSTSTEKKLALLLYNFTALVTVKQVLYSDFYSKVIWITFCTQIDRESEVALTLQCT